MQFISVVIFESGKLRNRVGSCPASLDLSVFRSIAEGGRAIGARAGGCDKRSTTRRASAMTTGEFPKGCTGASRGMLLATDTGKNFGKLFGK